MKIATVKSRVTDLRKIPQHAKNTRWKDPYQETQLLYGNKVEVIEESDGWSYVHAIEQPFLAHGMHWIGYPGWVQTSDITPITLNSSFAEGIISSKVVAVENCESFFMGSKLHATPSSGSHLTYSCMTEEGKEVLVDVSSLIFPFTSSYHVLDPKQCSLSYVDRERIIESATTHLGDPYHWGGCSPYVEQYLSTITGLDCSGLVYMSYRMAGITLPRNAKDQFFMCDIVDGLQLSKADLIFMRSSSSNYIDHVMLYAGNDMLIEAKLDCNMVRKIPVATRLGKPLSMLRSGDIFEDCQMIFAKVYRSF